MSAAFLFVSVSPLLTFVSVIVPEVYPAFDTVKVSVVGPFPAKVNLVVLLSNT